MSPEITVAIVDNNTVYLDETCPFLKSEGMHPKVFVSGGSKTNKQLEGEIVELSPDVVLMDGRTINDSDPSDFSGVDFAITLH